MNKINIGLQAAGKIADATTIWLFRENLFKTKAVKELGRNGYREA